jgi:hypothetical protein
MSNVTSETKAYRLPRPNKKKTQNQRVQKQAQQLLTKHLTTLFPTQMVEGSIQELMSFMPSQD